MGISHAVLFAREILKGKVIVAFADTLFRADFKLDTGKDGIIWVQKVKDPSQYGVVKIGYDGTITDLIEKPSVFVSDLAIIGIYFFRDGESLKNEMQYLLDNDIREKGEYQFTTALENMKKKGAKFVPGQVAEWLDCGNKDNMVQTNQRYLTFIKDQKLISNTVKNINSTIVPPVFLGENVVLENSTIGPFVSIGDSTVVKDSTITNAIIQKNCGIFKSHVENAMFGNFVNFEGQTSDASLGDYSVVR